MRIAARGKSQLTTIPDKVSSAMEEARRSREYSAFARSMSKSAIGNARATMKNEDDAGSGVSHQDG